MTGPAASGPVHAPPGAAPGAAGGERVLGIRVTPLTRRRWYNFKANRRGWWSLWIFLAIFLVTLFAELIANDRPLLVRYDGSFYFPFATSYPETTFGGEFETETDYRDPYVSDLIRQKGWIVWPPIPFSYNTINYDLPVPAPAPPSAVNWLGTDDQGRDVLARLIYGFRISVLFGLTLTLFSSIIGVAAGAVQGYFGGFTDLLFQRFIEIWSGLPTLYLLIILASVVEPNFWWLLGLLLLFSWMSLVGVVRAEFLRARNFDYVRAARALGVSDPVIMFRHVLPNAMVATLTFMPFILNGSITTLTALDFLGFGLPPGSPSLGELLAQGKANIQAPWLGLTAFFVLATMLSLLIFIGEAVRDAFDPRKTVGPLPGAAKGSQAPPETPSLPHGKAAE
ncbi:ABC transporter permease [Arenibaculum pallidiluteum]|uniref:ABC transporter permease n=1 Tax=Arenibaculum pallidiluteum TaxID=2812559 RepID=UPI001B3B5DC1|nr:ABC transporter permease [Arenibaculum pallidiluteum]